MSRIGRVNHPSLTLAVEPRPACFRDDHVDLTIGVAVMGAGKVVHQNHVHREIVGLGSGLDDPAESDAVLFVAAQPSLRKYLGGRRWPATETSLHRRGIAG